MNIHLNRAYYYLLEGSISANGNLTLKSRLSIFCALVCVCVCVCAQKRASNGTRKKPLNLSLFHSSIF